MRCLKISLNLLDVGRRLDEWLVRNAQQCLLNNKVEIPGVGFAEFAFVSIKKLLR